MITKVQKIRDMSFNTHGLYFDLQLHTSVLSWLRYSDGFSKLVHLLSEPTYMRYTVNLEIELSVLVLLDGANGTLGFKISVELRRMEFAFYGNILERA